MVFKQYNWAVNLKEKGYVATRFIITFLSTAGLLVSIVVIIKQFYSCISNNTVKSTEMGK